MHFHDIRFCSFNFTSKSKILTCVEKRVERKEELAEKGIACRLSTVRKKLADFDAGQAQQGDFRADGKIFSALLHIEVMTKEYFHAIKESIGLFDKRCMLL